ncbi:MAG: hypothetical protein J6T10_25510 [Methanobrevibacter sp.]|nr:hypothetical protein [Methanobrevibacter sp.]
MSNRIIEMNLYLSDLSEEAKKKYFEFFDCTKEEMYGDRPENKCYIASCFKLPNSENAIKEFDEEEALSYTE